MAGVSGGGWLVIWLGLSGSLAPLIVELASQLCDLPMQARDFVPMALLHLADFQIHLGRQIHVAG